MALRDRLRAFVSSSMEELADERRVVREALAEHKVDAWLFEADAGARPDSPRTAFLSELERADLYLGLFGTKLGRYTLEEYEKAIELGKPCLIYTRVAPGHPREPSLDAFIARLEDVDSGHTVHRFRELDELREIVAEDVLQWQVRALRQVDSASGDPTARALATLRAKVDQWYVRELLHGATARLRALPVRVESRADAVDVPRHDSANPSEPYRLGDDDFVRRYLQGPSQSLLILGEAGSGKSILMTKLLAGLLRQPAAGAPTPVMLRLSTWNGQSSLAEWLQAEIGSQYRVGRDAALKWLDDKRLALFLDGLDEAPVLHRRSCVAAVNQYIQQHYVPRLVVSCRTDEYFGIGDRLAFEDAVSLMPLDPSDVEASMVRSDDGPAVASLLQGDSTLRDLATSPLFLSLISSVPRDVLADTIQGTPATTAASVRKTVVSLYIDSAFRRRAAAGGPPRATALRALTWLARRAQQDGGGHIELERIQPSWLSTRIDRCIYTVSTRFAEAVVVGTGAATILTALVALTGGGDSSLDVGTLVLLIAMTLPVLAAVLSLDILQIVDRAPHTGWRRWFTTPQGYRVWILPAVSVGFFTLALILLSGEINEVSELFLSVEGLFLLAPAGALVIVRLTRRAPASTELRPRGEIEVDWRHGGLIFAVTMCIVIGLASVLGLTLMDDLTMPGTDDHIGAFNEPVQALLTWAFNGTQTMAILVLPFAIVGSIRTAQISATTYPNQGIVNATKVAAYTTIVGTTIAAAVFWFVFQSGPAPAVIVGLAVGVFLGFLSGGADALGHWVLRPLLSAECGVPVARFLDWAAEAGLLRRVGGRYVFRHALIAEGLATGVSDGVEADATARARSRRFHIAAIVVIGLIVVSWFVLLGRAVLEIV